MDNKHLQEKIKYTFKNQGLLLLALTHSSYANERKNSVFNERLEFLGDSVLSLITSQYLYENYKKLPEGELSKARSALVCEQSLYAYSQKIDLGLYLVLGKGEEHIGGRTRPSLLADAFEAVLGAVYLDGGIGPAKDFLLPFIIENAPQAIKGNAFKDYKTMLQEVVQKNPGEAISYVMVSEQGPDHNKSFECIAMLNSNEIGKGRGKSKKEAEQQAAKATLELMGIK